MIVVCKYLVPEGFDGITLYPFIFLKSKDSKNNLYLVNHERIHLHQQAELLIVFFYLWYLMSFFYYYLRLRSVKLAYKEVIFEREAYQNEHNLEYLKTRKFFSFLRNNAHV
ncbi:hypothetical protein LNQ81_03415 [Myroides sp. M-43]|uniref:hypothetical protein n=1 Tax=Myroides oncorhynchi TaxID=2893756 RepID=UPI001E2C52A5|nr:hypothetical protein [Myroides oncorhynchi]MCC9041750.1 hypothetical protein [Myroides oncorhynchi]